MAFKLRSQTFHTNVIFAYIIKTDRFHWYMVIVIGLKFYVAGSCICAWPLRSRSRASYNVWLNSFNVIIYSIQQPSPESKLHTLCSLKSGDSSGRGIRALLGTFFETVESFYTLEIRVVKYENCFIKRFVVTRNCLSDEVLTSLFNKNIYVYVCFLLLFFFVFCFFWVFFFFFKNSQNMNFIKW